MDFPTIPSGLLVPLFYAEVDASAAMPSGSTQVQRALLIGQALPGAAAELATLSLASSAAVVQASCGVNSMLDHMYQRWRSRVPLGEVWMCPIEVDPEGDRAQLAITITGTAVAAGALVLYIAGRRVSVVVASGDSASTIAAAVGAAINAAAGLPVTATVSAAVVTVTCRWIGESGNDIQVFANYRGLSAGESTPAGVGLSVDAGHLQGGSGAVDMAAVIAALGDEPFDFVVMPYSDDADAMAALNTEMASRWGYDRQIYGHAYTAKRGVVSDLLSYVSGYNSEHLTCWAFETDFAGPAYELAAAYAAANASGILADPGRSTQTIALTGVLAPRVGQRFTLSDRQSLLSGGLATSFVAASVVCVERAVTTYRLNTLGVPDQSFQDSETLHLTAAVLRRLKSIITSKYPRHKLADDGTRFGAGVAVVTPAVIRGELLAAYRAMELEGWVENYDTFAEYLVVERDATDVNRINVLFPPDYVNNLRVLALLNQFRLQYAQAA